LRVLNPLLPRTLAFALALVPSVGPLVGPGVPGGPDGQTVTAPHGSRSACSPLVRLDGYSDKLNKTTYHGTFVGNLSGLDTYPNREIVAVSDRSALFTLNGHTHEPIGVVPLADEHGQPLDSEAVVRDRNGTLLITSETEPSIRRYSRTGQILDRLTVPPQFAVAPVPVDTTTVTSPAAALLPPAKRLMPVGRTQPNLSFEGMALQPGGRELVVSMEEPLYGDQDNLTRFLTWNRGSADDFHAGAFRPGEQYAYQLDPNLGISELHPTGDGRLLVLERGFMAGYGNDVRLYVADLDGATDVRSVPFLTSKLRIRPIHRTLLADLIDCPSLGAKSPQFQTNPLLDNIEGMTVIGHDKDSLRLMLISDDNASAAQVTRLYFLTVQLPRP
jgi:hypothetical protein